MKYLNLKSVVSIILMVGLFLGLIAVRNVNAASDKPIKLRYGTPFHETFTFTRADKNFFKKIEKETDGRVTFEIFAGGTLISFRESLDELKNRVADLAYVAVDTTPGFQLFKAQRSFYYGIPNTDVGHKIYSEVTEKFPEIEKEWTGVQIMARVMMPAYQILTVNKPIRTLDDLKGLKMKCTSQLVAPLKELGVEGVNIPISETYIALQKGIVDGLIIPQDTFKSFNLHEVIKYCTRLDYFLGAYPQRAFNLDALNSLPKDIQKIFMDNIEWWGKEVERLQAIDENAGIEAANKAGVKYIEFEPGELEKFHEVLTKVSQKEVKKLEDAGFPGKAVFNEIRTLVSKYSK
ncbi:MAG: TRAP transporter substrate-binding protein DctP [Deltaproteobacteria bacterium]|nr:TRAP transporter substrate-binding protein DctP [Deltaproteobacteria bacterium]